MPDDFGSLFITALLLWIGVRAMQDMLRPSCGGSPRKSLKTVGKMLGPYLKAVVAATVTVFVIWQMMPVSPLGDMFEGADSMVFRLVVWIAAAGAILPLSTMFTPFVFLIAAIVVKCGARRGYADILTGMLGASLPVSTVLMTPQLTAAEAWAFVAPFPLAGALGGFVFWRSMGYPGIASSGVRKVERARMGVDAIDDLAGGTLLGVGRTAHALYRASQDTEDGPPHRPADQRGSFGKQAT